MAEAVDPAAAALAGPASDYSDALSIVTGVTCDADTPAGPRYIVTKDMDLSPKSKVAYRGGPVGWLKATIDKRLSATNYNQSMRGKRPLSGIWHSESLVVWTSTLAEGPCDMGHGCPQGAAPKAPSPKPKTDPSIDISPSSDSSSQSKSLGPDQLRPPPKQDKRKKPR
eukprot:1622246-Pyramimonas_sp.AAC.1